MFREIEQRLAQRCDPVYGQVRIPLSSLEFTLDDIFALYTDALPPERRQALQSELKHPDSEAARLLKQVREALRAQIDIRTIPGLKHVADSEARIEEQRGHAS